MLILAAGSIPTLKVKMTIGYIEKEGGTFLLFEKPKQQGPSFYTPVPKSVREKLEIGDTIDIICVPVGDISFATETLALCKYTSEKSSRVIFDKGQYWK